MTHRLKITIKGDVYLPSNLIARPRGILEGCPRISQRAPKVGRADESNDDSPNSKKLEFKTELGRPMCEIYSYHLANEEI